MKIAAFTLFTITCTASARIGETPERLVARYGQPVAVDEKASSVTFEKNNLKIVAVVFKGKCARVEYWKLDGTQWDEKAIWSLLEANRAPSIVGWAKSGSGWKSGTAPETHSAKLQGRQKGKKVGENEFALIIETDIFAKVNEEHSAQSAINTKGL